MFRKKPLVPGIENNLKKEHNKVSSSPNTKDVLKSYLYRVSGQIFEQDYESVQAVLLNFGVVAALLLSMLLGLILTVPVEETVSGDILSLSLSSPHFRCHFAPANATSIEICSPNYTIALFGTTNRTIICNDGPKIAKNYTAVSGGWTISQTNIDMFYCTAPNFASIIRTPGANTWLDRGPTGGNFLLPEHTEGCSSSTFKEAYRVAKTISDDDYMEYMMEETTASDSVGNWFGKDFEVNKFWWCRPSSLMASDGFKAILMMMLALFFDLYLLISLTFTSASTNPSEMRLWWSSGGVVGALLVLYLILTGTVHFVWSLMFLVVLRFPFPFDQMMFNLDCVTTFKTYGLNVGIYVLIVHFFFVRMWTILRPLFKSNEKDQQACIEIKEIEDEGNRKLLQKENVDVRKLKPFLDDTLVLNSLLLDAGIKTLGDRLEIIATLKTIDRENTEGSLNNAIHTEHPPIPEIGVV